jgi:hypothetical protein
MLLIDVVGGRICAHQRRLLVNAQCGAQRLLVDQIADIAVLAKLCRNCRCRVIARAMVDCYYDIEMM